MQTTENNMLWLPLAIPLAGAVFSYIIGRIRPALAGWTAAAAALGAALAGLRLILELPAGGRFEQELFVWLEAGRLRVPFVLRFDGLTAVMCAVVTGVGSVIHLYAIGYMRDDRHRARFFAYMNLFLFAMLLLVFGGSLLVLFAGWEGVGLCSYLLIGFWFENRSYAAAGKKAFIVNRIGDAGFLLGMFLLLQYAGTLDFVALRSTLTPTMPLAAIAFCFFVGAVGKSAQIPLHVWLPDAMAGPTPVSALIHAATMVTAGVYLLSRMHFLYSAVPQIQALILAVAVSTAFFAAATALTQHDIKKVLAYSTISQLGFMFAAAAVGAYSAGIFHVVTHSFFKACLFLGAGSVIFGCHHEQDMRKLGGLWRLMPVTFAACLLSGLAIAGIFPFSGYYSKHAIMQAVAEGGVPGSSAAGIALNITAVMTGLYMTRSLLLTFAGRFRGKAEPHEALPVMLAPLAMLALLASIGGVFMEPVVEALGSVFGGARHSSISITAALAASWPGALGIAAGLALYALPEAAAAAARRLSSLSSLALHRFYVDEVYEAAVTRPLGIAARVLASADLKVIDGAVDGTAAGIDAVGERVRRNQSGQLGEYALFIVGAFVLLVTILLLIERQK